MKTKRYKDWVPAEVVTAYERVTFLFDELTTMGDRYSSAAIKFLTIRKETYDLLVSHDGMATVWPKIVGSSRKRINRAVYFDDGTEEFASAIWAARRPISPFEAKRPGERSKIEKDLISHSMKVVSLLQQFQLDIGSEELFTPEELKKMQRNLAGYGWDRNEIDLNKRLSSLPNLGVRGPGALRFGPGLSELLARFAKRMTDSPPSENALLSKPGNSDPELTYFLRYMTNYLQTTYGRGQASLLADVAAVFFPDQFLSGDQVREKVGRRPKSS